MFIAHINKNNQIQTASEHCANTADLCMRYLVDADMKNISYLTGLLHDSGKFTEEFTNYIQDAANGKNVRKGEVIHSFAGVSLILGEHHDLQNNNKFELLTSEIIASAVGAHHGLFDCIDEEGNSGFEHRLVKQPEYDNRAIKNFSNECCDRAKRDILFKNSCDEIKNILEKIIKISSDETELHYYISMLVRLLTSAVVDADRGDTANFMEDFDIKEKSPNWDDCIENLNSFLSKLSSDRPIDFARQEISNLCFEAGNLHSGIYKLNVPTGGGKTLSGLRFALNHCKVHNKKRIILISPLLSILDQNAKTVKEAINNDEIIFEHHSNIIKDDLDDDETERYNYLADTWNSPIIITTLVQFLNALFLGKMSAVRRFHSLCDSVIVIDEIQTLPIHMLTIVNLAINFLSEVCKATIVMCSATQPSLEKTQHSIKEEIKEIIPKNVISKYEKVFKRTEIVDNGFLSENEIVDFLINLTQKNKSTLIICNKKAEAQNLFSKLLGIEAKCFHLSAGMCQKHREDTLESLKTALQNGEKVICVSTQVIEAGVDISFDTVVRYAAGLDNIIQSAGRCNRNGEKNDLSKVYIVNCKAENLKQLESISKSKTATESLLNSYSNNPQKYDNDISSDKSIYQYYSNLYEDLPNEYMDYQLYNGLPSMYELLSDNKCWNVSNKYWISNSLKTAGKNFKVFDDSQVSVIVPYGEAKKLTEDLKLKYYKGYDINDCYSDIQNLKPFSVSVPVYQYKNYHSMNAITELFGDKLLLLDESYYDNQVGILSKTKEDEKSCNILIL
ncbi:MAG: CRISPR-associated helicase Cas3' [Clostridiales bacterium]|nr:CRISPR-associated helicase Cas3' [Clostridiales bacterium]